MRRTGKVLTGAAVLLVFSLPGCGFLYGERESDRFDIARMAMPEDEDRIVILSGEERSRLEKERFPGLERLDLVRVLVEPAERQGPCWSEVTPPVDMKIDAAYGVRGRWADHTASGFAELGEQGWRGIYRTPAGTGFERRARFEDIDLTVETEFVCKCMVGSASKLETVRRPARIRLRWQGKGAIPEVSGRVVKGERTEGLRAEVVGGSLLSYTFPVAEPYPVPQPTRCGGKVGFQLLIEPPFL